MRTGRRVMLAAVAGAWAIATLGTMNGASAQSWPTRPVRVIIPISAGSAADVVPRLIFEEVSHVIGHPFVIENRPGAGSTIGARAVAQSDPDGYTLLAISSAHTIAPAAFANLGYDPHKDLVPVASLGNLPNVLVIAPSKNIKTVQQLVEAGKSRPIQFGSIGANSPIHLSMERFRLASGIQTQAIPFRGAPEAITETMTGRIDVYYSPISSALPLIQEGKLVPLAVSSRQRASALPNVPTTLEAGYPNSDYNFWIGVFAPANTPRPVIDKLNAEIVKTLKLPAVQEKLAKIGVQPMPMSTADFAAFIREDFTTNAVLAKAAGLTPQ
jgi:tripartite-type tricarboxylate transporter receptor subunit TctC